MTNTPTLPNDGDGFRPATVSPEAPRPKRPWTILGRLSRAVREQNWFAVVLEVLIVIVGVVMGFQVTAWGQASADRAREQTYLHQLATDLHETLQRLEESEDISAAYVRAGTMIMRAFWIQEPPPEDSMRLWLGLNFGIRPVEPVTASSEALAVNGDLALIRDDSLRRAVPVYLSQTRSMLERQSAVVGRMVEAFEASTRFVDYLDRIGETLPQTTIDSLAQRDDTFGLPAGPRTQPFFVRASDVLSDREAYRTLYLAHLWQSNLRDFRAQMRSDTERLLALVQSAQGVGQNIKAEIER